MNILKLIRNNVSLLVVLLVLTAILGGCSSSGGGNGSSNNTTTKQSVNKKTVSELSLMGLSVGDKESKIEEILGKPKKKESRKGKMIYIYDDLEVEAKSGTIIMLVSDGKKATTKRGLHEGVSFDEVLKVYGSDNTSFKIEDMTAYEYEFKTADNYIGLLRFAVNNSDKKVNYISARLTDEKAVEKRANTNSSNKTIGENNIATKKYKGLGMSSKDFHKAFVKELSDVVNIKNKSVLSELTNPVKVDANGEMKLHTYFVLEEDSIQLKEVVDINNNVLFVVLLADNGFVKKQNYEQIAKCMIFAATPDVGLIDRYFSFRNVSEIDEQKGNVLYKAKKNAYVMVVADKEFYETLKSLIIK